MTTAPEAVAITAFGNTPGMAIVTLAPGEDEPVRSDEWQHVLVLVQSGTLRLRCHSGRTATFTRGSIVYFEGLPLRSIGADGCDAVVLMTLRRVVRP